MAVSQVTDAGIRYGYRAAASGGRVVRGYLTASGEQEALAQLEARGLTALSIRARPRWEWKRSVRTRDLAVVFGNVATLVQAGVPIERAIGASEALVLPSLAVALTDVRRALRDGLSVGDAFSVRADVFPRAVVGVLQAGERAGAVGDACSSIAEQLEAETELRAQIRSSLAYPALILVMGVGTIALMAGVVVPRFALVLGELGAELPRSTSALLAMTDLFSKVGLPLLVLAGTLLPLGQAMLRQPGRRAALDRTLLGIPLVGSLRLGFASARTCRALGGMLTQGMPLLPALDAAAEATGDEEVSRRLARARSAVARGAALTPALAAEEALSPLALQLVGVGEASSRLGPMISRAGDVAAGHAERRLRTLVTILEPALVVTLGAIIAAVAAALLQAVYSVRPV